MISRLILKRGTGLLTVLAFLSGCSQTELGTGGSMVSGSAGAAGAQGAATSLPRCSRSLGTAALVEPEAETGTLLKSVGLQSPIPLLRLIMQQSGCFQVVDRGAALSNIQTEQALQQSGMLKANSVTARGHMVTVEYLLTPNIVFDNPNAGGGGAGGGLAGFGAAGLLAGALMASMRVKEAQTTLFLTDAQSGVQTAVSEGSAKARDYGGAAGFGGIGAGIAGFGGIGGYSNTAEGKLIAAALLDAYNKMVSQLQAQAPAEAPVAAAAAPRPQLPQNYALVKSIQTELIRLGYYAGSADGFIGKKTRDAITDFQKSKSMPPDGQPTQSLLDSLKAS